MAKTPGKIPNIQFIEGQHDLTFFEQLKIFRLRQGWSAEDLGKRLGLTSRSVTMLTSGVTPPTQATSLLLLALSKNPKIFDDYLKECE